MFPVFVSNAARNEYLAARSLRFNGADAYLSWTPARAPSNPQKWTRSFWFKRTRMNVYEIFLGSSAPWNTGIFMNSDNSISVLRFYARNNHVLLHTNRRLRDTSGWMHWHEEHDATQADARLRRRVWINGVEETSWRVDSRAARIPQNGAPGVFIAESQLQTLGRQAHGGRHSGIHTAEFAAFDGAGFGGPADVTGAANINGVWSPLDLSGLAFGKNGFWLNFADAGAPGTDISGNANHWAAHNITAQDSRADDTPTAHTALPQPRIEDVREVFQAVLSRADSVEADLAAARADWFGSGYAEIFKLRSAAGQWRIRFSHGPAHEYRWGGPDGQQASTVRHPRAALPGGAEAASGYAVRSGARFGTAAGSVRHTHGAATKVTHNLGHARGVVLLFKRGGTNETLMYHPDCAAGNLTAFGRSGAPKAHGGVTGVSDDAFNIGAAMPSDTYDYLVMTEASGCFKAASYTGNGSSDGPQVRLGLAPVFFCAFPGIDRAPQTVTDALRDPFNSLFRTLTLDLHRAERDAWLGKDFLSDGFKIRSRAGEVNRRGGKYFVFAFGQPAATGARAR